MPHPAHSFVGRLAFGLVVTAVSSSCSLLTFDCGGPTTRESLASATMRDAGDTLSVDGYATVYEERRRDGSYLHQLVIGIQATDAAHYDTIPTALRPHVTGASIVLPSGSVLYHVVMTNNTSQLNGPPVLAAIAVNDVDQSLFDNIRSHLLANDLTFLVESDSTVQFPRGRLAVQSAYDWRKSSGCQ